ncbi:hypothetical protein [Actinophytocola oryzae]|uniref:Uncharacterized protein n=1 Tax=Actinophytocola oryzae TaxID=502181 RepID=A0A4R7UU93_9PSEU|nr:hypothetical protein [Actinophytocola oryzae]TDV37594.1 hypothetical protein CLV71_12957 [Actinophytocola oryzae]
MRWQIPIVWVIGSVVTGTIAVLLTTGRGYLPLRPVPLLSGQEMFTLVVLVAALFIALFALGWRTVEATWLRWSDPRSVVLWALLVGGAGLGGWGFAAAVTFDAGFSLTAQLILVYTCGGLPFALVAGMLARPVVVNAAAVVITVIAVLVGLTMMDSPLQTLVMFLQFFVGGGGIRLL